jgi:hypothetical protein
MASPAVEPLMLSTQERQVLEGWARRRKTSQALTSRKLRRSAHRSVTELEADIRKWINEWNKNPRQFVWTKTADEILGTLAAHCRRINDSGLGEYWMGSVISVYLGAEVFRRYAAADGGVVAAACAVEAGLKPDDVGVAPLATK